MAEKEYIDKELVMDTIDELKAKPLPKGLLFDHLKKVVEVFPTRDFAPVKHGHWTWKDDHRDYDGYICSTYSCSNCGKIIDTANFDKTPYCPNCGAKMDGGENNET